MDAGRNIRVLYAQTIVGAAFYRIRILKAQTEGFLINNLTHKYIYNYLSINLNEIVLDACPLLFNLNVGVLR